MVLPRGRGRAARLRYCARADEDDDFSGGQGHSSSGGRKPSPEPKPSVDMMPDPSRVRRVAAQKGNVLITGQTGTGKSLCAQIIHQLSSRKQGPLVVRGCGTFTDELFKAELFGHEKGAFTDAVMAREGMLAAANGGTLVLDDIDCLSLAAQQTLLQVVEQQSYTPIGRPVQEIERADVRYIVTTNRSPEELIETGLMREDVYHRLCRWRLHLSPLHERPETIKIIAEKQLAASNKEQPEEVVAVRFDDAVYRLMSALIWDGNIRQLKHAVENLVVFGANEKTGLVSLKSACDVLFDPLYYPRFMDMASGFDIKKAASVKRLLELIGGNRRLAARLLNCAPGTLYSVIEKAGWDR